MSIAIKIEGVSKQYRLGTVGTGTISHDLNRWWHTLRGKEDPYAKVGQVNDRTKKAGESTVVSQQSSEAENCKLPTDNSSPNRKLPTANSRASGPDYVWALRDINLEVQQGEILGIIGRNGAGKSTLLKLLSRVTAPTTGSIKTKGRIASLLEVGTGFHEELTGRENIFLNGAILGMKRHEVTQQLDDIVEFSGCARYLDTPVKRYSSGMMVRLGFAVAAHLQCEVLIVDEVLAVGDLEFQNRCIEKMEDVGAEGRTVIFVSHNLTAVRTLCHSGIEVSQGQVVFKGTVEETVTHYLERNTPDLSNVYHRDSGLLADAAVVINTFRIKLVGEQPRHRLIVEIDLLCLSKLKPALLAIDIFDSQGMWIMQALPSPSPILDTALNQISCTVEITLPPLIPGVYRVGFWTGPDLTQTYETCQAAAKFEVVDTPTSGRTFPHNPKRGHIVPESRILQLSENIKRAN